MKKNIIFPLFFLLLFNLACNKKSDASVDVASKDSVAEVIDSAKILPTPEFKKELKYEKYVFDISAKGSELTITPTGLEEDNSPLTQKIQGKVKNAEIGDINGDNKPEVFIYLSSEPSDTGSVIAYSSNAGKSMSEVNFPKLEAKAKGGYKGYDEFAIGENTLVQKFPLFDTNGNKTGKIRQIQYKLKEGEAMRTLVVDRVVEF